METEQKPTWSAEYLENRCDTVREKLIKMSVALKYSKPSVNDVVEYHARLATIEAIADISIRELG